MSEQAETSNPLTGKKTSKKKKQQLYMIVGGALLLLVVILFSVKKSKDNANANSAPAGDTPVTSDTQLLNDYDMGDDSGIGDDGGDDFGDGGGGGGSYTGYGGDSSGGPWNNGYGNYGPGSSGSQLQQEEQARWQQSWHPPYRHGAPPYSVYYAQQGDTMSSIGIKYGVDSRAMSRANGGNTSVTPGQSVNIPHGAGRL